MGFGDATFRALADRTRRDILQMLRAGPMTSGEIASRCAATWPTVSRHLAVLREGGLVVSERRGQEVVYELDTTVFQDLLQHVMQWTGPQPRRRSSRRPVRQQEA
jgi:DNA-binding transcriptional ArsR family regulator